MPLVESLLSAIVRADGDALVMHVGEKPYVVAPSGQVDLSSRGLTLDAMAGMLDQLLPHDGLRALDEFGAVEHELPPSEVAESERFTVVAARGGDDIWIELRRHRPVEPEKPAAAAEVLLPAAEQASESPAPTHLDGEPAIQAERDAMAHPHPIAAAPSAATEPAGWAAASSSRPPTVPSDGNPASSEAAPVLSTPLAPAPVPLAAVSRELDRSSPSAAPPWRQAASPMPPAASGVVLPLSRNHVRPDQPPRAASPPRLAGLDRLLRVAAARGASTLYLASQARPALRVDGEIGAIEEEPPLSASDVESLILDLVPDRNRDALRSGLGAEWICDVPDVGRVRCLSFRDHRGAGGIFRIIPSRPLSAEQLGLSREIQALSAEPEGLLLVTGPRSSGKSTLIAAFVDLINRTRSDHVITLESQIQVVHENRGSLVSQREVRGDSEQMAAVARAALRENPDVLVIEDLRTPEVMAVALDAAESGHLVIGSLSTHTTTTAIARIIDQVAPDRRPKVQLSLAEALRGVVAQVLVRKSGGGRVAARELLFNTPSVANVIAEGKTSQLPLALDSGRKFGMVPLNDALVAFVQSGAVDSREAYRKASDRQGFLGQLRREGIDTSFVERLA